VALDSRRQTFAKTFGSGKGTNAWPIEQKFPSQGSTKACTFNSFAIKLDKAGSTTASVSSHSQSDRECIKDLSR